MYVRLVAGGSMANVRSSTNLVRLHALGESRQRAKSARKVMDAGCPLFPAADLSLSAITTMLFGEMIESSAGMVEASYDDGAIKIDAAIG